MYVPEPTHVLMLNDDKATGATHAAGDVLGHITVEGARNRLKFWVPFRQALVLGDDTPVVLKVAQLFQGPLASAHHVVCTEENPATSQHSNAPTLVSAHRVLAAVTP